MKHITMHIVFFLLLLVGISLAQYADSFITTHANAVATVTLTDTASDTIYVMKSYRGQVYCSTTKPVFSTQPAFGRLSPMSAFSIKCVASTGMAAGETDSLQVQICPLYPDYIQKTYVTSQYTYAYLAGDAQGVLAFSTTTLDWTDGYDYYCGMKDTSERSFWTNRAGGYSFIIKQFDNESGIGVYTLNFFF